MATITERGRRGLSLLLKGLVSAILLGVVLWHVDAGRLWASARRASLPWLALSLVFYLVVVVIGAWRWNQLLRAQGVAMRTRSLTASWLVALFFNNFLPSNIGGDVARIADTTRPAGSGTLATTVVLVDRGLGLLGLMLVAAVADSTEYWRTGGLEGIVGPSALWMALGVLAVGAALPFVAPDRVALVFRPFRFLHPEWIEARVERIVEALHRFRSCPMALLSGLMGAVAVQLSLVAFYWAIARSMQVTIVVSDLAVIVPVSLVVQMLPVSLNGLGVREATFVFCFRQLGLPLEWGLLLSFVGAALALLVSLAGAVIYAVRRPQPQPVPEGALSLTTESRGPIG